MIATQTMDSSKEALIDLGDSSSDNRDQFNDADNGSMQSHISKEVAGQLWQAGKQSTQKFIKTYAHIDFLRPYFDVEPKEFRNRLIYSFVPKKSFGAPQEASSELYGPLMLTFSLVAVILYGMKSSGHEMEEGTLIGTALAVCFGYWLGVSSILLFFEYLCNVQLTAVQTFSLIGYSLSGHCSVLLISIIFDHYGSPGMFYTLWIVLGGLSGLKVAGVYISRTWSFKEGAILSCIAIIFHMFSILYLRLEYHKVYEGQ